LIDCLFNVNCPAQLGEILQQHQHANISPRLAPICSVMLLVDTYLKDMHRPKGYNALTRSKKLIAYASEMMNDH